LAAKSAESDKIINGEYVKIWKELVFAYLKVLSQQKLDWLYENHTNLCDSSWLPDRD
jgi:hypothetical protein